MYTYVEFILYIDKRRRAIACKRIEINIGHGNFVLLSYIIYESFSYENHCESVAKSLHQDRGPCYLHLPIFFL